MTTYGHRDLEGRGDAQLFSGTKKQMVRGLVSGLGRQQPWKPPSWECRADLSGMVSLIGPKRAETYCTTQPLRVSVIPSIGMRSQSRCEQQLAGYQ